jgi:hypothetical protein
MGGGGACTLGAPSDLPVGAFAACVATAAAALVVRARRRRR